MDASPHRATMESRAKATEPPMMVPLLDDDALPHAWGGDQDPRRYELDLVERLLENRWFQHAVFVLGIASAIALFYASTAPY
jgi:hypothetical protein